MTASSDLRRTDDPIHRVAMAFERDGDSLWVFTWLDNGGHLPEHFHPTLTERWEVLEGSAGVKVDGRWRELAAREGLYNARNLPTGLRGAAWVSEFALRFRDETVMCSPPPAVQRLLLPAAARLTRRYRA
jgi:hypothetical protein